MRGRCTAGVERRRGQGRGVGVERPGAGMRSERSAGPCTPWEGV